jgi:hypothetical protein
MWTRAVLIMRREDRFKKVLTCNDWFPIVSESGPGDDEYERAINQRH